MALNLKEVYLTSRLGFYVSLLFPKSSDSETQSSQNLGTIIVETSQKISPIEDGRDQKESDEIEDSHMQGKRIVQTYSKTNGKVTKVYTHFS